MMHVRIPLFSLAPMMLWAIPAVAQQATIHDQPLSARRVSYTMNVTLEPETRVIHGTQRVTWQNPDKVPVSELQFHLYLNAFKNPQSTFMKESGGTHRGFSADDEERWGSVDITRMRVIESPEATPFGTLDESAVDLMDRVEFIQPDDDNEHDETVISVRLPDPVGPGETIALDIDFTSKMPEIVARTGWKRSDQGNDFFMVAQWFPKLGVYEVPGQRYLPANATRGQWNTHQFHANSEFYADFGTYDVTITTPDAYTVGASGVRVDEQTGNGTHTVTYRAEDVHDFAWTASPDYIEHTDTWRHVNIRLLVQPQHESQAQRHFDAARAALERFDEWVGEYPYATLTLVDGIGGSNGMEYPTLITCGTVYMLPKWARLLELVTVHEFGHQYFYGVLASNEFEEAWLDEGLNSYVESRIMDDVYGRGSAIDLPGFQIGDGGFQRLAYTKSRPGRGAIFTKSWEYEFSSDYGKTSYSKPATVLATLENHVGWETMRQILRTYYERWSFRHPTTRDFIDVANEVSGEDLSWFFDQYVYGTAVVDYEVEYIINDRIATPDDADSTQEGEGNGARWYESKILVHRKQDGTFPLTLEIRFDDGSAETVTWDGADEYKQFTFEKDARAVEAYLDPNNDVWLDVSRLDNRVVVNGGNRLARKEQLKFTTRIQQLFFLIASLF